MTHQVGFRQQEGHVAAVCRALSSVARREARWHRLRLCRLPCPDAGCRDELFVQTSLFLNYKGPFSSWIDLISQDFFPTIGDSHGKVRLLAIILDNGD